MRWVEAVQQSEFVRCTGAARCILRGDPHHRLHVVHNPSIRIWQRANESTPQKSIKRSAGITSVQELLEQLWDRRTGKIVNAHAMGRPHDDRLRCRSRRPIQGAKNEDLQFGPLSY